MSLVTVIQRLFGKPTPDVTEEQVRKAILERQAKQEARLRALDLRAAVQRRK